MKNVLMFILKGILIFIGVFAISMALLGTFCLLFKLQLGNIWESALRVSGFMMLIIFADWYRGKHKSRKEEEK